MLSIKSTKSLSVIASLAAILLCSACEPTAAGTRIVMLGTGTPVPDPERSGPAVAIVVDDTSYLFDSGPGVMRQASVFSPRFGGEIEALAAYNMNIVFLTHLHSDHIAGFSDLLSTGWNLGRSEPVQLYGPEGVKGFVDGIHAAFRADIQYRSYGLQDVTDQGWRVETHSVSEGLVYENAAIKVHAFPVIHGTWPNAFGYRIETKDRVIIISGDLRPNDKIREYSKGADYLIHEVYCNAGFHKTQTPAMQKYHAANHTSTEDLARLATEIQPGKLVLYHVLPFGCTDKQVMDEIRDGYDGEVIFANDLDVFE